MSLKEEGLKWVRYPMLDSWEAESEFGRYTCIRTYADVAVLFLDGKELRRSGSDGGHYKNKAFAEEDYFKRLEEDNG